MSAFKALVDSGELEPNQGCSDYLRPHVASHFVNARQEQKEVSVTAVLAQAVDYGHPQLAEEAHTYLERLEGQAGLAPPNVEAHLEALQWDGEVGRTKLVVHRPIWEGIPPLEVVDLQDRLIVDEDLAQLLRVSPDKREEVRQCLCLHVAIALGETWEAAFSKASALRRELWEASI